MEGAGDRAEGFDSIGRAAEVIGTLPESNWPHNRGYGSRWGEMEIDGTESR